MKPTGMTCQTVGFRRFIPFCIAGLFLVGCATDAPEPPPPISFYVHPAFDINDGRLVYMIVRNVNEKQFLDEEYNSVASKAFPSTDDPALLGRHPILPGENKVVTVNGPAKGTVAIYFLFTDPGPYWRTILEQPLDTSYTVELPSQNKVTVGPEPGFFDRLFSY